MQQHKRMASSPLFRVSPRSPLAVGSGADVRSAPVQRNTPSPSSTENPITAYRIWLGGGFDSQVIGLGRSSSPVQTSPSREMVETLYTICTSTCGAEGIGDAVSRLINVFVERFKKDWAAFKGVDAKQLAEKIEEVKQKLISEINDVKTVILRLRSAEQETQRANKRLGELSSAQTPLPTRLVELDQLMADYPGLGNAPRGNEMNGVIRRLVTEYYGAENKARDDFVADAGSLLRTWRRQRDESASQAQVAAALNGNSEEVFESSGPGDGAAQPDDNSARLLSPRAQKKASEGAVALAARELARELSQRLDASPRTPRGAGDGVDGKGGEGDEEGYTPPTREQVVQLKAGFGQMVAEILALRHQIAIDRAAALQTATEVVTGRFETRLAETRRTILGLTTAGEAVAMQYDTLRRELEEAERVNQDLKRSLDRARAEADQYQTEADQLREQIPDLEIVLKRQQDEIQKMKEAVHEKETQLREAEAALASLQKAHDVADTPRREEIERLRTENRQLSADVRSLEEAIAQRNEQVAGLRTDLAVAHARARRFEGVDQELAAKIQVADELEAQLREAREAMAKKEIDIELLTRETEQANLRASGAEAQLAERPRDDTAQPSLAYETALRRAADAEQAAAGLRQEVTRLTEQLASRERESQTRETMQRLDSANAQLRDQGVELEARRRETGEQTTRIQQLERQIAQQEEALRAAAEQAEPLRETNAHLLEALQRATQEKDDAVAGLQRAREGAAAAAEARQAFQRSEQEKADLQAQLDQANQQFQAGQAAMTADNDILRQQLAAQQAAFAGQLADARARLEAEMRAGFEVTMQTQMGAFQQRHEAQMAALRQEFGLTLRAQQADFDLERERLGDAVAQARRAVSARPPRRYATDFDRLLGVIQDRQVANVPIPDPARVGWGGVQGWERQLFVEVGQTFGDASGTPATIDTLATLRQIIVMGTWRNQFMSRYQSSVLNLLSQYYDQQRRIAAAS